MRENMTRLGLMAAVTAAVFALTPTTAFGQRGTSSRADEPAASESAAAVQPAPQTMQRGQMQRGRMQGQQGRGQGMQAGARLAEREQLEQMREHMVAGMRRMATRLAAVQDRILALDRGQPDAAPPVEMGRGVMGGGGQGMRMQGMQMQDQGMRQGMQRRDGECLRMQPTDENADVSSEGADR